MRALNIQSTIFNLWIIGKTAQENFFVTKCTIIISKRLMEEIWIIGVGHFGYIAFQRLSEAGKARHFILVDPVEEHLLRCESPTATLEVSDGLDFCQKHLKKGRQPDWIIPALPVHLAAEWLLLHLGPEKLRRIPMPADLKVLVPNAICSPEGNIYVSHADFRCPVDCDEPRDICTVTGDMRKHNMFELLGNLDIEPFKALNIQSHQLGPGIGGYRPDQLYELMENVEQTPGPILVSTACRCHGVITGLERI